MRQPSATASIVPAGPLDAPVLASLLRETMGPTAWTEDAVADLLEHGGGLAHLAAGRAYGEVMPVGCSLARVAADEAELLGIGVLAAARGAGVGRRLLDSAIATAAGRGAQRMVLEVAADNATAKAMYHAAGFGAVGARDAYYSDDSGDGTDAEIFARDLSATA